MEYTIGQKLDYMKYIQFLTTPGGEGYPRVSIEFYLAHKEELWAGEHGWGKPIPPDEPPAWDDVPSGPPPTAPAGRLEYEVYLAFLDTPEGQGYPRPTNYNDYLIHKEEWAAQYGVTPTTTPTPGETPTGEPAETPAGGTPTEPAETFADYSDEQVREYYTFGDWGSAYGKAGDWFPFNIDDYFTNYETAQQQLSVWQALEAEQTQEREEYDQWALSPEEQARRREESYELAQYARQEVYHEQPRYSEQFAGWIGEQADISHALRGYVERKYPSLRAEYEGTLSPLTGFPTREEARAEAAQRESGWEAWLEAELPDVTQDYYAQRPAQRDERYWIQSPTLRSVQW